MRGDTRKCAGIEVCRLPQESGQPFRKVGGMLAAPAGYFKYQSLRWQYAPQHFEGSARGCERRVDNTGVDRILRTSRKSIRPFDGSRRQLVEQRLRLFQIEPFSAKRSAYSDMPSFSSHSAICCIAPRPCDGRYGLRREDIRPTLRGELPADLRGASVLASLTDLGARRRQHCRRRWVDECP